MNSFSWSGRTTASNPIAETSGNRFLTCIESIQLRNSAFEALGFETTNAFALITRLFSCCIASLRVDAVAIDVESSDC